MDEAEMQKVKEYLSRLNQESSDEDMSSSQQEGDYQNDNFQDNMDMFIKNKRMCLGEEELEKEKLSTFMLNQNYNTPMMCSLSRVDQNEDRNFYKENYVKSVRQKNAPMHWLGYLYKKIHQNEKEYLVKLENQGQQSLEQNVQNIKYFLPKRLIMEAQEVKNERLAERNNDKSYLSREKKLERQRLENIQRDLQTFEQQDKVDGIDFVGDIWEGGSIFSYDPKKASLSAKEDDENAAERAPDFLKQTWEQRWESFDSYWFQEHKNLAPKHRKQELPEQSFNKFYSSINQSNTMNQPLPNQTPQPQMVEGRNMYPQGKMPNQEGGVPNIPMNHQGGP